MSTDLIIHAGETTLKAHDLAKAIKDEWNAMSKEEQIAVTEDALEEIKEIKEMKKLSVHNQAIAAFHDFRGTMDRIQSEVRTGCLSNQKMIL